MPASRLLCTAIAISTLACAAAGDAITQSVNRAQQQFDKTPKPLAIEFRMYAAKALEARHPELARKFINVTLEELRAGKEWVVGPAVMQALAELSPADAVSVLPRMAPGNTQTVIDSMATAGNIDAALSLYRDALARGQVRPTGIASLLGPLAKQHPAQAGKLFEEALNGLAAEALDPSDAWWLLNTAGSVIKIAPGLAADAYECVIAAASAPDYGAQSGSTITANLQLGSAAISTTNSSDTLLLVAGARLRALAPERFHKLKSNFAKWDLSASLTIKGVSFQHPGAAPANAAEAATVRQRIGQIRSQATDTERARLVTELAAEIGALPAGVTRLGLIRSLCGLATEGDLGRPALSAVAQTLAETIRDTYPKMMKAHEVWPYGNGYIELARLVRYEHVEPPFDDPALDAAVALLELREQLAQENGFSLTALDGKSYSLAGLKGRVVMLNFWATWCPPCRKEMPDMEKLFKTYERKGLTVLAVSDEDRETVEKYLARQNYTFAILLDPGRKVNDAFNVDGIPKTFVFDREGRLAAQAIDMRTEPQFLEMLKKAGL